MRKKILDLQYSYRARVTNGTFRPRPSLLSLRCRSPRMPLQIDDDAPCSPPPTISLSFSRFEGKIAHGGFR